MCFGVFIITDEGKMRAKSGIANWWLKWGSNPEHHDRSEWQGLLWKSLLWSQIPPQPQPPTTLQQDENTITFNSNKNDEAETIAEHINKKLSEIRNGIMQHQTASITPASSPADEIRKYKELLDMDAITKEEFDLKKKQILGL